MSPLLELLILIFLLWIWAGAYDSPISQDEERLLSRLRHDLDSLFEENIPTYRLFSSPDKRSYTHNKEDIYLLLRHPQTREFYAYSTLLRVAIHELAHIMCPDQDHTTTYYQIEGYLEEQAVERGLLDPNFQTDPEYPCEVTSE
jgi:hypothetical protein